MLPEPGGPRAMGSTDFASRAGGTAVVTLPRPCALSVGAQVLPSQRDHALRRRTTQPADCSTRGPCGEETVLSTTAPVFRSQGPGRSARALSPQPVAAAAPATHPGRVSHRQSRCRQHRPGEQGWGTGLARPPSPMSLAVLWDRRDADKRGTGTESHPVVPLQHRRPPSPAPTPAPAAAAAQPHPREPGCNSCCWGCCAVLRVCEKQEPAAARDMRLRKMWGQGASAQHGPKTMQPLPREHREEASRWLQP